ncbi:MAG: tail fiber domain-containing protein [Lachnospiraceae bacterium]|nr:tail fiber domain-containing protein [Lachnospiraceae bacterium]
MALHINFDPAGRPEIPTIILADKSGKKLGELCVQGLILKDCLNSAAEITFDVHKYVNGRKCPLWEQIKDFKLIWCKEWDTWFEIKVTTNESSQTTKIVSCTELGPAELSQIILYGIEINTEDDIARQDYKKPTVFYNGKEPENSLLNRILEKAPHYSMLHVDHAIKDVQRTFSFDNISIYDALQEIAQEIGCLFIFQSGSEADGTIKRTISAYDLESNGLESYGTDTAIFITSDELAEEIQFHTDTGAVKNCFKLEGGDDLMTAAIRSCNPNGSDYIWYITDELKKDMSKKLAGKLKEYEERYQRYQTSYTADIPSSNLEAYNQLARQYQNYNPKLETISLPIKGYPALMTAYYHTVDLALYLKSTLMPDAKLSDTTAAAQAELLTVKNLSPVAVANPASLSEATASSAVLAMAKTVIDPRYQIKVKDSSLSGSKDTWSGNFTVTSYTDKEDTAESRSITISIDGNLEAFIQQKIHKMLNKKDTEDLSISGLFKKEGTAFANELKKYSLARLASFLDACRACLDILIEEGAAEQKKAAGQTPDLYAHLYQPYFQKQKAIEYEMVVRQKEINQILGEYDKDKNLASKGTQSYITMEKEKIQKELDFPAFLDKELWTEFCSYRREDTYSNKNYISDGLNNAELFEKAQEFIKAASREIYKSAELQHSISTTLKNLLVIKKFKPLVEHFAVGNWIRIQVDEEIYKLRLLEYEIDFDNLEQISVEFSDIVKGINGTTDLESIFNQAKSMASSYDAVQRQASQGAKGNQLLNDWVEKGLNATHVNITGGADLQCQTWDSHGMLFRQYDSVTDSYYDEQLKIINSTLAITDDNWKTVKTAIGGYYYTDPANDGKLTYAYGINAQTLVGKLILGESLGIYSDGNSLTFNSNGLCIRNDTNTFTVNPNSDTLLSLSNQEDEILYVDSHGTLHIQGDGAGLDISSNNAVTNLGSRLKIAEDNITTKVSSSQFGTLIEQNPSHVKIAWNNISKYIQFENSEIRIYENTSLSSDALLMKMTYTGNWYYYKGATVGKIGTNGWDGDPNFRGLMFDLQHGADYMGWGYQTETNGNYIVQLIYYANSRKYKQGLHLAGTTFCSSNLYINDYVRTANYEDGSGGLYSQTAQVSLCGTTVKLKSSGATFECLSDRFIFYNSPSLTVDCYNNINLHNYSILNQSDARLKTNITDSQVHALSKLNQIELKEFDWIETGLHEEIGMIAQQLQPILPELVYEDSATGQLSIKTNLFIPYLIKAVQELYAQLNEGQAEASPLRSPARQNKAIKWSDCYTLEDKNAFIRTTQCPAEEEPELVIDQPLIIPANTK